MDYLTALCCWVTSVPCLTEGVGSIFKQFCTCDIIANWALLQFDFLQWQRLTFWNIKIWKLQQLCRTIQRISLALLVVFSSQILTEPLRFFPCPDTRLLFLFLIYKANLARSLLTYADSGLLKAGAHFNICGHRDPLPSHKRILGMFSCGISALFYS